MKNFTKKIKRKSILVLLSLFTVFFLLSVTFTMSKYVIEKQAGNLTLNITGAAVLLPGLQFRNTLGDSVTEVVFGRKEAYEQEIVGIEPKNVGVKKEDKIELYADGAKAYILSNRKIYANPISFQMFYNLKNLTTVYFSNFDTGIVTDMSYMFFGCDKLTDINVSSWNTERVKTMRYLFYGCSSLTSLDLSRWNIKGVKKLEGLFHECKSLESLDLSGWNPANAITMFKMFDGCEKLASLDLSGWNTAKVTNMSHMFHNCGGLVSIYVGSGWNTDEVSSSGKMFTLCKNLSGGEGTAYDDAYTDKAYARIDGGTANPGYFTDIADKP